MSRFFPSIIFLFVGLCFSFLFSSPAYAWGEKEKYQVILSVRSGPEASFESRLFIESTEFSRAIKKAKRITGAEEPPLLISDVYVTIVKSGGHGKPYRLEPSGELWNETDKEKMILPKRVSRKLIGYAQSLRDRHYGQLVSWEEAKHIVPRKSIFSVTDLETGLTFRVQRRAGRDHADVQPLTREDTKIMKEIYGGRWSWKRKAILVHTGNRWLAASMNGMPHGGDGIPNNGFSGHFCIHFLDSTTHRSDKPDLAHQLMVHKGAGKLQWFLDRASPPLLANLFVEAMNQQDPAALRQMFAGSHSKKAEFFVKDMEDIASIRVQKVSAPKEMNLKEDLSVSMKVRVEIFRIGQKRQYDEYFITIARDDKRSPWRIQDINAGGTLKDHSGI